MVSIKIVSDDAVNVVNSAIGSCELDNADLQLALEPILAQGAAEGITIESVAYGGADPCGLGINLTMTPANLSTVAAVGGSSATVDVNGRLTGQSALLDTNGGVSATVPLPAWQAKTAGVRCGGRNVPDIVIPGSVNGAGPSVFAQGQWSGGIAFANNAPFAGYLATVAQYYGYATPLGNVAPALYSVFDAHGYKTDFTDIIAGNIGMINGVPVSAKPGYDLATGIGTIRDGYALMKALGTTP